MSFKSRNTPTRFIYWNRDKRRPGGPPGSKADFIHFTYAAKSNSYVVMSTYHLILLTGLEAFHMIVTINYTIILFDEARNSREHGKSVQKTRKAGGLFIN